MTTDHLTPIRALTEVQPGDIALGPIGGLVGAGVGLGQLVLGEGFAVGPLKIRHARIVVKASETLPPGSMYDGQPYPTGVITAPVGVEAMPSGARTVKMMLDNAWTSSWAYFRLAEDYPGQAQDAAAIALAMVGTPYSWLSYAALALWRLTSWGTLKATGTRNPLGEGRPGLANRLERWINRRREPHYIGGPEFHNSEYREPRLPCEAICSVLVDQSWSLTGKKIMEGVPHQVVTPGALAARLLRMDDLGTARLSLPNLP